MTREAYVKRCRYRLVASPDLDKFQSLCDQCAQEGFFPHGEPFFAAGRYHQAFRRDVRVPDSEKGTWEPN